MSKKFRFGVQSCYPQALHHFLHSLRGGLPEDTAALFTLGTISHNLHRTTSCVLLPLARVVSSLCHWLLSSSEFWHLLENLFTLAHYRIDLGTCIPDKGQAMGLQLLQKPYSKNNSKASCWQGRILDLGKPMNMGVEEIFSDSPRDGAVSHKQLLLCGRPTDPQRPGEGRNSVSHENPAKARAKIYQPLDWNLRTTKKQYFMHSHIFLAFPALTHFQPGPLWNGSQPQFSCKEIRAQTW